MVEKYSALKEIIEKVNNSIDEYNEDLSKIDIKRKEAQDINNKYTLFFLYSYFEKYFILEEKHNDVLESEKEYNITSEYNKIKKDIDNINNIILSLIAKKEEIQIAVEEINNKLNFVTYTDGYLKIIVKDKKYYVLVNNKKIKLNKLSTGQRNLISLCYFFAKINENKEKKNFYSDEILLVLDDPISSFDYSNRIGILSLLRYEFGQILLSNKNSKLIVQTHDSGIIYDLKNIILDIDEERKVNNLFEEKIGFQIKKLMNFQNEPLKNYKPDRTYTELMTIVYNFGNGVYDKDENNPIVYSIGNIARRVLEAFSTFNYNKGMTYLRNNKNILNLIKSEKQKNYYKNFMNKLILNSESHTKENIQTLHESCSISTYSYEEKKRIAQDTISFLYLIDKYHVENNILNFSDKEKNNINNWINFD